MTRLEEGMGDGEAVALPRSLFGKVLAVIIAISMLAMMTLGFADVVGRYALNAPVRGALPIMGILLGLVIFAGLPIVTLQQRHITVDLFDRFIRGRFRRFLALIVQVIGIGAVGYLTERLWSFGTLTRQQQQLHSMIDLPLWPLAYIFAVFSGLTTGILIAGLFRIVFRRRDEDAELISPDDSPANEDPSPPA